MTPAEVLSVTIAFLALIVSVVTAYRTLFTQFSPEIHLKPRVIFNRLIKAPSIVLGLEIVNHSAQSGTIDDVVLYVKYHQRMAQPGGPGLSTFVFLPALVRDDYNIFKTYTESDLEPFQSIAISGSSRLTKYIVFSSGISSGFSPLAG